MVNWNEMKGKAGELAASAKGVFSQAADKTQKSAKIASLKVKIVMEENKVNKAMGELGRKVYELIERGEKDLAGSAQVKEISGVIASSKATIKSVNDEITSIK
jgi:hypothetical protein